MNPSAAKSAIWSPMRTANAREALGRKLAETASQTGSGRTGRGLRPAEAPRRIEVYDNSHIMGTNAVGAMIVAGPEGFVKNQYRKFNIKDRRPHAGRRFRHDARGDEAAVLAAGQGTWR
jgi:excinuclease UvrABC nuclease subunit